MTIISTICIYLFTFIMFVYNIRSYRLNYRSAGTIWHELVLAIHTGKEKLGEHYLVGFYMGMAIILSIYYLFYFMVFGLSYDHYPFMSYFAVYMILSTTFGAYVTAKAIKTMKVPKPSFMRFIHPIVGTAFIVGFIYVLVN